jgi:hypothetical protein
MSEGRGLCDELGRIRQVSDTLCTGHAGLRDRFARRALVLDVSILALSTWLVALAFVEPRLNVSLTPFGLDSQIWVGLLAVGTFFLTIIQIKTDWKGQSDAHKRTLDIYAEVKREAGYLLATGTRTRGLVGAYSLGTISRRRLGWKYRRMTFSRKSVGIRSRWRSANTSTLIPPRRSC